MVYDPSALQCKNCGLRFSTSQSDTESYSKHLDWHFRVKRREKDNAKKAESRRWYFEKVDWIVSDEIEEDKGGFIQVYYSDLCYHFLKFVPTTASFHSNYLCYRGERGS